MALVVEDGTGLSNANGLVSVADATTYLADYGNPSAWTSASTAEKETAIRQATRYMESRYRSRYIGVIAVEGQALGWPRTGAYVDGYEIDDESVPTPVANACAELAVRALSTTLLADLATPGAIKREAVQVGPVRREREYAGAKGESPIYQVADGILSLYLRPMGELRRA